jgi:uncharacterized protein YcbK (DUF882 family)
MDSTRRRWMGWTAGAAALGLARPALAQMRYRRSISRLHVIFTPTGREWRGFWDPAGANEEGTEALTTLCADHRTGARVPIDRRLWSALALIGGDPGLARWEVISGYRSQPSNIEVGGAADSQHRRGKALDVRLPPDLLERTALRIMDLRLGGVGLYPQHGFLHFDTRGTRATWYG